MGPRLIAIDLDGTLVRADGAVDPRDAAALHAARRSGALVAIATGRSIDGALAVARALPVDGPLICADGRLIACARTGAVIEIVHPGETGKGRAVAWAAGRCGVRREDVAAVGDWVNDVSMLAWAGMSFAMREAPEVVRRAATETLEAASGTGGGVAEAIERWLSDA